MLANVSPRGRLVLAGSAVGIVVLLYLLMQVASAPSYTTLLTGLNPAQTGKVTAALDQKGIGYELQNNGTALAVDKGKTAQARIALASAGVGGVANPQPGFELLDKQSLGTSNFQQQINYQRALEGQLAQTIEQIDGVTGAQVQLVLPDKEAQLFAEQTSPATAAVLLSGSTSVDPGAVRGIAQLVASSVPNLSTDKVTITDGGGQLLWPTSAGGGVGAGSGLLAKQAAESRYDATLASSLNAMLTRTLGPDKAQVQVNADLDANQATQEQLTYGKAGVPLQQRKETEALKGAGGAGGGVGGTGGNIPAYAQAGGGGNSNYKHNTTDETLGVDKTVTHTQIAPGAINSQQVSVLLDKSVPAAAIPQIRAAVANAAGIQAKRGDTLSVGQVAFAKPPAAPAPSPVSKFGGYLKYLALGLGSLLFLFFVTRQLRRREQESLAGEPTWLREIEAPRTLAELERRERDAHAVSVAPLRTPEQPARLQVEDLVTRDPERVAQQVRAWMSEEER
jgi:flagellar M-ring protein FliF